MTNTVGNIILKSLPERSEGSFPPLEGVGGGRIIAGGCFEIPACAGMTELNLITKKYIYYGK
jgi:hypothetical protein